MRQRTFYFSKQVGKVAVLIKEAAKSLQFCPTLCDPIDGGPPGSPIPGILQARTLEWVAISFSKGIFWTQESNPGLLYCRQILYLLSYGGKPPVVAR